jgi:hypothetical protein
VKTIPIALLCLILALHYPQIQDDGMPNSEDLDASKKQKDRHDDVGFPEERLSHERANHSNAPPNQEVSLPVLKYASGVFLFSV